MSSSSQHFWIDFVRPRDESTLSRCLGKAQVLVGVDWKHWNCMGVKEKSAFKMASVFVSQIMFAGGANFRAINDFSNLLDYFMSGHEFSGRCNNLATQVFCSRFWTLWEYHNWVPMSISYYKMTVPCIVRYDANTNTYSRPCRVNTLESILIGPVMPQCCHVSLMMCRCIGESIKYIQTALQRWNPMLHATQIFRFRFWSSENITIDCQCLHHAVQRLV